MVGIGGEYLYVYDDRADRQVIKEVSASSDRHSPPLSFLIPSPCVEMSTVTVEASSSPSTLDHSSFLVEFSSKHSHLFPLSGSEFPDPSPYLLPLHHPRRVILEQYHCHLGQRSALKDSSD